MKKTIPAALLCAVLCIVMAACANPTESGQGYGVRVTMSTPGAAAARSMTDDSLVAAVSILVTNTEGARIGGGSLEKAASCWGATVIVAETGTATFTCSATDSDGAPLYRGSATQVITGEDDSVSLTASAATWTLTYDGNGSDGGSVPTDSGAYARGDTATVSINTGTLSRTGYVFTGWNTAADGSGTDCPEASRLTFASADVTLFARWVSASVLSISGTTLSSLASSFSGSLMIPHGIKTIGYQACNGCSGLTRVSFPSTITTINGRAFRYCSSLDNVRLPDSNTAYLQGQMFEECTSLKTVTLPSGTTEISNGCFSGCTALESITIPPLVSSFGNLVFWKCSSLKHLYVQNATPATLGSQPFNSCYNPLTIHVPNAALGAYQGNSSWNIAGTTLVGY